MAFVTAGLAAVVAFLVGISVAGAPARALISGGPSTRTYAAVPAKPGRWSGALGGGSAIGALPVNFADVVERINPAVVNVEATARGDGARRRSRGLREPPDLYQRPDSNGRRAPELPHRGTGSGFIIDADGSILTNNHVIEGADRISVKLADGRSLRARVIGIDPDTDVALIKVDGQAGLPVAPIGDSSNLRTGEWVCAIGNPLGYEHTVTVGVVSYRGRKLFDPSLDDYIQTDAAINFGNSGGPLINARGEVIGINAAISSRASSIGFAVPINVASAIIPQLRARGRVSRGYIGVGLRDVDRDLERSLNLPVSRGAFVQDVASGSPAERAGLRPYDVILAFDGVPVANDDELIRRISGKPPGTSAAVRVLRDGREIMLAARLAERPAREAAARPGDTGSAPADRGRSGEDGFLGLAVRDLDASAFNRYDLPRNTKGVLIIRVEPMSASFDADVQRGTVLLEINRKRIESASDFRRVVRTLHPGDVVALYLYAPELDQRQLKTVTVEDR